MSFRTKTAEMCFSKTCVKFWRCYGNQRWAEEVENYFFVFKISSFKKWESFKSLAHGVLEIFEEVYIGWGWRGGVGGGTMYRCRFDRGPKTYYCSSSTEGACCGGGFSRHFRIHWCRRSLLSVATVFLRKNKELCKINGQSSTKLLCDASRPLAHFLGLGTVLFDFLTWLCRVAEGNLSCRHNWEKNRKSHERYGVRELN